MIDETDLRIDTFYQFKYNGNVFMKITHMPSGLSVQGENISLIGLKNILLIQLEYKLKNSTGYLEV
jgi:hypothetical protein